MPDVEAIEHLDFAPPCERDDCDAAANWLVVFGCCGHEETVCDRHLAVLKDVRGPWLCANARMVYPRVWSAIRKVLPL